MMPSGAIARAWWPELCAACAASETAPTDTYPRPLTHYHDGPYGLTFAPVAGCNGCEHEKRNEDGTVGPFDAYEGGSADCPIRVFPMVTWFDYLEWRTARAGKVAR